MRHRCRFYFDELIKYLSSCVESGSVVGMYVELYYLVVTDLNEKWCPWLIEC